MEKKEVKLGWYAFAGGKFSADPNAYPNCQGVVAWLNPNTNAPAGKRGLILAPDEVKLVWSDKNCETGIDDEEDGQANTLKLIVYGKEHGINFPAAEWCYAYSKNVVKPGEGFLPALNQLKRIIDNRFLINPSLLKIGGKILNDWAWSSSEYGDRTARFVFADGCRYQNLKGSSFVVRCVIAF